MTKTEDWFLVNLIDTEPNRDMGDLKSLKNSIEAVGLICPLAIDTDGRLLAGHRRYHALIELGWEEAPCVVFPAGDEVLALRVAIDENFRQLPLLHPERAVFIKQFHDLMCERYGQARRGERTDLTSVNITEVWTQDKTAEALGVSQETVSKALQVAEYIEKRPELAGFVGCEILAARDRERQINEDAQAWKSLVKTILEEETTDQEEKKAIKKALEQNLEDIEERRTKLEESLEWIKNAPPIVIKEWGAMHSNLTTVIEVALQRTYTRIESFMVIGMVKHNLKKRPHYPTSVSLKTLTKTVRKMILKENKSIVFEEGGNRVYRLVEDALIALTNASVEDESVPVSERVYRVEGLKK